MLGCKRMANPFSIAVSGEKRPGQPLLVLLTQTPQDLSDEQIGLLSDQARQRGWRVLDIGLAGESLADERTPSGAVVTALPSHPLVSQMRQMGSPVVRIGRLAHPADPLVPAVLTDWSQAGRMAADHFAERGFGDVALFGHHAMAILPLIEAGFHERVEAQGRTCHRYDLTERDDLVPQPRAGGDRASHRAAQIIYWLKSLPKPVGVLACSQYYAGELGLMCRRAGLSMPEQVAVLSVGDQRRICEMASVPISAVDMAPQRRMSVAIDLLDRMMAGQSVPARTFVPPRRIVTRRSTDILAVDHPLVARAIRFMWDRLDQDLSVDEVARAMRTPRSTLERYFREHFQRGIHAELRRARLERFAELLRTTDLPVRELAPRVGFNAPKFLHNSFCKEYGVTPRQYRLQHAWTRD
jgi:LacI family transcriptional regulator